MEYRHGAHTVFTIHLHLVWTTKYLESIMTGEVRLRIRELIRQLCREEDTESHEARTQTQIFVRLVWHDKHCNIYDLMMN